MEDADQNMQREQPPADDNPERAGGLVMGLQNSRKVIASKLTAAEKKVLTLVSLAYSNKEIAAVLHISPSTVKRHLENILRKLGAKNRVEAAIYGLAVNGCPRGSSVNCPLELWHRAKASGRCEWAILPIDKVNGRVV